MYIALNMGPEKPLWHTWLFIICMNTICIAADRIELTSGIVFQGKIVSESENRVIIDIGGTPISIYRTAIAKLLLDSSIVHDTLSKSAIRDSLPERMIIHDIQNVTELNDSATVYLRFPSTHVGTSPEQPVQKPVQAAAHDSAKFISATDKQGICHTQQTVRTRGFSIGFRVGGNRSWLYGKDAGEVHRGSIGSPDFYDRQDMPRQAPCAALTIEARFCPFFALQTEVSYIEKGESYRVWYAEYVPTSLASGNWTSSSVYTYDYRIGCIEVPILLKVIRPIGSLQPILYAGPFGGLNVVSKMLSGDTVIDRKSQTHLLDFGVCVGGGLEIRAGFRSTIVLDCRFCRGITNIENELSRIGERTTQYLSLSAGYRLNFYR